MSRVVLAMSGGVDSSVAAHLLQQQGHEVVGVFMRHGVQSPAAVCSVEPSSDPVGAAASGPAPLAAERRADHKQGCCSASDAQDARRVADRLDIPFYALDMQSEFAQIMDYFVAEYTAGRTPNPCVVCNNWLKFGKLFEYADAVGAEFVATGHYARLVRPADEATPHLLRGVDTAKDQSYVLFGVQRRMLSRMLLPVGEYRKPQIRQVAGELGLRVADKRDSQEICFVTSGEHAAFVRQRRGGGIDTSGEFVTNDGRVLGNHDGIERFTVGQRKGLGIAVGQPLFVLRIDPDARRVVLGRREELACRGLSANRTNWLTDPPSGPFRCRAMIRYNAQPAAATAQALADDRLDIQFDEPRFGVAPGQAVVCYDQDRVLGGGWIEQTY